MDQALPDHLKLYDSAYFTGGRAVSGYADYNTCKPVLERWAGMVELLARPTSVLDVGCAYGFVVESFRRRGIPAVGIECSEFARAQARRTVLPYVIRGALPELPDLSPTFAARDTEPGRFDAVLCTEVLEHLPEELVPASIDALAAKTDRLLITLIMVEGHPTAHDDAGHLCLHDAAWWNTQFDATQLRQRADLEQILSDDEYSQAMGWSDRFFVRERQQ